MALAVGQEYYDMVRKQQAATDAALQNVLKGLRVRSIPAKDLTLQNLREGLQQQPQKWAPVACQLCYAAPAEARSDEALVSGLAAHLAKACSGAAASRAPTATWVRGALALSQLLTLGCPVVLEANTILPIYTRCLRIRAVAAIDLTWYLFSHQILADAVFQHPTLLLSIIQQLGAEVCQVTQQSDMFEFKDLTDILSIIIASRPLQVAAHSPFVAALQQLLAAAHIGATYLLQCVSKGVGGRQLITCRPELAVALAGGIWSPGFQVFSLSGLDALVALASSPDSSPVVLAHPACCGALVQGMAAALYWTQQLETSTAVGVWTWLQQLVAHEPSRQLLLSCLLQQVPVGPGEQQGAGQGTAAAAAPPQAAAAAGGAGAAGGQPAIPPLQQPPPQPSTVPGVPAAGAAGAVDEAAPAAAAVAAGGVFISFLANIGAALQQLPPGAEAAAGSVLSTLLETTPDQQQLLEALQVPSWLNNIRLDAMPWEAQLPWAQAVALLLSQPAGRAALWGAPWLLYGLLRLAGQVCQDPGGSCWLVLRVQIRQDAGYQAALLQGLRAGDACWMMVLKIEVSEVTHPSGGCPAPTYSVLQLPGLPQALADACMQQQGPSIVWLVLPQLLRTLPGQALLNAHPLLVAAVAGLLARAGCDTFGNILSDMYSPVNGTGLYTYVLSQPQLLKGLVLGAVGAGRQSPLQLPTAALAAQPWFRQVVEGDGEVLDALLRALGPVAQSQQLHQHQGGMMGQVSASCQEVVLAQLSKEALFPKLLQRLSNTGDVKLVQGAWNGLDWLRRSGAPWDEAVPRALGNMVKAAGRARELPQLQLAVTQTAVQLAQEHAALREQQQLLEAARAQLAATAGGGVAATAAAVALPPQQQQQEAEGQQEGGRKRRPQRTGSGRAGGRAVAAAAAAAQHSSKRARRR